MRSRASNRVHFPPALVASVTVLVMFASGCASPGTPVASKPREIVEWRENELTRDADAAAIPYGLDDRAKQVEKNLGIR